jgi:hypothetical protein
MEQMRNAYRSLAAKCGEVFHLRGTGMDEMLI